MKKGLILIYVVGGIALFMWIKKVYKTFNAVDILTTLFVITAVLSLAYWIIRLREENG